MKTAYFIALSLTAFGMSTGVSHAQGAYPSHATHPSLTSPGSYSSNSSGASRAVHASLQASVSKELLQDEVRVTFAHQAKGSSAAEVNRALAQVLDEARASVKGNSGFTLSSGSFRTSPSYDKNGKTDGWQGRAELVLTASDFAAAETAAGILGTQLAISNIQFSLSEARRRQEEQSLLTEVAKAFRDRAQAAAKAFGFERYRILSLDFGGPGFSGTGPVLMRSAAPMSAPSSDPIKFSFDPSLVKVTIDVSGKVTFD